MRKVRVTIPSGFFEFGIADDNALILAADGSDEVARVPSVALTALASLLLGGSPLDVTIPETVHAGPSE